MKTIPTYSKDLIEQLDQQFPERCPEPNDSERMVWIKVLNFLKHKNNGLEVRCSIQLSYRRTIECQFE
jgi:hypothetical protein